MRLRHQRFPGEVQNTVNGIILKYAFKIFRISEIALNQPATVPEIAVPRREIVEDQRFEPVFSEGLDCVAANVARATGNEDH